MPLDGTLFGLFAERIAALPARTCYDKSDLLVDAFRIYAQGNLSIYLASLDVANENARVSLIGITPGWTQMEIAYRAARLALLAGQTIDSVCARAKAQVSFAGPMRGNLISMLDGIGLPVALGITTCEALFGRAGALLHTTSAIRYPVFVEGENYAGHRPKPLRTQILRDMARSLLMEELRQIPDALVIPLGACVDEVVRDLVQQRALDPRRCLFGFPHPSGGNAIGPANTRSAGQTCVDQSTRGSRKPQQRNPQRVRPTPALGPSGSTPATRAGVRGPRTGRAFSECRRQQPTWTSFASTLVAVSSVP
jgi:hypothetical protein